MTEKGAKTATPHLREVPEQQLVSQCPSLTARVSSWQRPVAAQQVAAAEAVRHRRHLLRLEDASMRKERAQEAKRKVEYLRHDTMVGILPDTQRVQVRPFWLAAAAC